MVHELANQPISVKRLNEYLHPKHRALEASKQTRKQVDKLIQKVSTRLYVNAESPIPSDLPLYKAANRKLIAERSVKKSNTNFSSTEKFASVPVTSK